MDSVLILGAAVQASLLPRLGVAVFQFILVVQIGAQLAPPELLEVIPGKDRLLLGVGLTAVTTVLLLRIRRRDPVHLGSVAHVPAVS